MLRRAKTIGLLAFLVCACGGDDNVVAPPPPLPNYTGIWSGNYTITSCTETGDFALVNFCAELGGNAPFTLNIIQQGGNTNPPVQGTFNLGSIPFTIATGSSVASNGSLSFQGTAFQGGITILVTWALTSPVVGTITQAWTYTGVTGQMNITGAIGGAVKTGSVGREVVSAPPPTSLRGLVDAVAGR
jgi:hypothetical protein